MMREAPALLAEATGTIGGKEVTADAAFDVINRATARVLAAASAVSPDQLDARSRRRTRPSPGGAGMAGPASPPCWPRPTCLTRTPRRWARC